MRRLLSITPLLVAMLAAPCMNAQRMGSGSPRFAGHPTRAGHARAFFYPLAFSDPFYSDYLSSTGYPVASQPPVIILQTPPPTSQPEPFSSPSQSPAQPLMIELQGDRYVRVSGEEMPGEQFVDSDSEIRDAERASGRKSRASDSVIPASVIPAAAAQELPPAVLVFRDGRSEEVSEYTIADGVLYTRSDYYTTGSWNRKIALSSLNLLETTKSNQARGLRFRLPSASNEVIVGP
jgi:hypothetical protein